MKENTSVSKQEALIVSKILTLRDESIILDVHLAEFYGVETRALKQAVRRNRDRFPADFMFELTEIEMNEVVSQNVIPSKQYFGGANPFAFTENIVAMLSSVLKSEKAIDINIAIMRAFTLLRKAMLLNKDIVQEIRNIRVELKEHDHKLLIIFDYLKQLEKAKQQQQDQANRKRIGFRQEGD
jgi:hypothetical protein